MWTAKGQTKSVHNSEVSTLVKLGVVTGHKAHNSTLLNVPDIGKQDYIVKTKQAGRKVSTVAGCPQ